MQPVVGRKLTDTYFGLQKRFLQEIQLVQVAAGRQTVSTE